MCVFQRIKLEDLSRDECREVLCVCYRAECVRDVYISSLTLTVCVFQRIKLEDLSRDECREVLCVCYRAECVRYVYISSLTVTVCVCISEDQVGGPKSG